MNELIEIRRLKNSLEGEMRNSKSLVNQSYLDLVKANIEVIILNIWYFKFNLFNIYFFILFSIHIYNSHYM